MKIITFTLIILLLSSSVQATNINNIFKSIFDIAFFIDETQTLNHVYSHGLTEENPLISGRSKQEIKEYNDFIRGFIKGLPYVIKDKKIINLVYGGAAILELWVVHHNNGALKQRGLPQYYPYFSWSINF